MEVRIFDGRLAETKQEALGMLQKRLKENIKSMVATHSDRPTLASTSSYFR